MLERSELVSIAFRALLRAWIRFATAQQPIRKPLLTRTLEEIEAGEPQFYASIASELAAA